MEKKQITEEMNIHKEWYKEAKNQTVESLPQFLKKLTKAYSHDYGTICHAIAASAIASMWAVDKSEAGGITGFQAGAIMWEVIRHWNYENNKCGLKIVDYDNFCFPQYGDKYEKTITKRTWENIQNECKRKLKENEQAHVDVIAHWEAIVSGKVPFGYDVVED